MGVLVALGLDISNFIKDVPNFVNDVPRWGSTSNHFWRGFQMK